MQPKCTSFLYFLTVFHTCNVKHTQISDFSLPALTSCNYPVIQVLDLTDLVLLSLVTKGLSTYLYCFLSNFSHEFIYICIYHFVDTLNIVKYNNFPWTKSAVKEFWYSLLLFNATDKTTCFCTTYPNLNLTH